MSFNTLAVLDAIVTLLTETLSAEQVTIGAPLSISKKLTAYVTLGAQPQGIKTQGTIWRDARFFIDFAYRVDDNIPDDVATAESTLAATLDALEQAIYDDKTLDGVCFDTIIEAGTTEEPEYRIRAAREFREYAVILTCRQYTTYEVNPT